MQNPKMHFILKGFSQVSEFRVFAFEGITADWTRSPFTVRTNLALTRQYRIRLQELPLLCRTVLERRHEGEDQHAFTFTEKDMRLYADGVTAREEAARRKKPRRRPPPNHGEAVWRVPSR